MNPDRLELPVLLVDDAGVRWLLRRKRVDLRLVRRLMKDGAATVVLGEMGGMLPRVVADGERSALWDEVGISYMGAGGDWASGRYLAHEFRTDAGRRMLFIEDHC